MMIQQKIFFSYSRADGSAFALRLAGDLKKRGFDVWIDQEDIKAGLEWDTEIEKALESCDCVLFIETEKSVVSTNVLDEVYYALEQHKKVIPLIYVDSKTPFRLQRLQHIDFTKNYDAGLTLLVNELEGKTPANVFPLEEKIPSAVKSKPFYTKKIGAFALVACLAVLIVAGAIVFSGKRNSTAPAETKGAIAFTDTTTDHATTVDEAVSTPAVNNEKEEDKKAKETTVSNKRKPKEQARKTSSTNVNTGPAEPVETKTESRLRKLGETAAGDWRLTDMEPKANSQHGYLKIEAVDENKATIKSYMQFYYPDSKASSYLTIFNAFAGCTSCALSQEMKLKVEDIAVASRTIKTLQEDQPDGRKAGEVILDANSNKSIDGTITLQFIDDNTAVIKVKQPLSVELAHGLMLEPFVYTFRFKKAD